MAGDHPMTVAQEIVQKANKLQEQLQVRLMLPRLRGRVSGVSPAQSLGLLAGLPEEGMTLAWL